MLGIGAQNTVKGSTAQDFESIKAAGNQLFSKKEYAKAAETYTTIVEAFGQLPGTISVELIRTVLANRAACYLELLSQSRRRLSRNLDQISTDTNNTTTHHAKGVLPPRSKLLLLGRYDEALLHLDRYRRLNGTPHATETELRMHILEKQANENQNQSPGNDMKPIEYEVLVIKGANGMQHPPLVYKEEAYQELCVPSPSAIQSKAFLVYLVQKHHDEIMGMQRWVCWQCPKGAVSISHNPMSYLNVPEPRVVDFALPVCENGGKCDREARAFFQHEMEMAQRGPTGDGCTIAEKESRNYQLVQYSKGKA
ncbi:hypothetical protein DFP72DRAFT_1064424 [Ephemerocybe angulata]|uniref:Uncharacterized protein n=1 Tax=Ephemerocybe angulata TaxID=980116 RepID=A0A8H6I4V1_9AGAR|nr:hypothetical protein DFP72DRAFT_1064424 [Tulosesus angulatus]